MCRAGAFKNRTRANTVPLPIHSPSRNDNQGIGSHKVVSADPVAEFHNVFSKT
jgi:hypothetical protein